MPQERAVYRKKPLPSEPGQPVRKRADGRQPTVGTARHPGHAAAGKQHPLLRPVCRSMAQFSKGFEAASPDDFAGLLLALAERTLAAAPGPGRVENPGPALLQSCWGSIEGSRGPAVLLTQVDPNYRSTTGRPARAGEQNAVAGGKVAACHCFWRTQMHVRCLVPSCHCPGSTCSHIPTDGRTDRLLDSGQYVWYKQGPGQSLSVEPHREENHHAKGKGSGKGKENIFRQLNKGHKWFKTHHNIQLTNGVMANLA